MYTFLKKLAAVRNIKSISGYERSESFIREESFDVYIEQVFYRKFTAVPERIQELVAGMLLYDGVVPVCSDILSCRICEQNRVYILLAKDRADVISAAGGLYDYMQSACMHDWDNPVPLSAGGGRSAAELAAMDAGVRELDEIKSLCEHAYYAVYRYGQNSCTVWDTDETAAANKLAGLAALNGWGSGMLFTNMRPRIELVRRAYLAGAAISVFHGVPTNPVHFFAVKTGMSILTVIDDEYYIINGSFL